MAAAEVRGDLNVNLDIDTRTGWPVDSWGRDLGALAERFPRETWRAHENLGEMARFWLQRHDMFRELGGTLADVTAKFRDGALTPQDFQRAFTRRLQFFLEQLEGHHHVEDAHYFPRFRAADDRTARGFDVLEADHEIIHADIAATVESANGLLRALASSDNDTHRRDADAYAGTSGRLLRRLTAHLRDEEDIIIPMILERGESTFEG